MTWLRVTDHVIRERTVLQRARGVVVFLERRRHRGGSRAGYDTDGRRLDMRGGRWTRWYRRRATLPARSFDLWAASAELVT